MIPYKKMGERWTWWPQTEILMLRNLKKSLTFKTSLDFGVKFFQKKLKSKIKAKTRRMEFTKIIASEQRTSNP